MTDPELRKFRLRRLIRFNLRKTIDPSGLAQSDPTGGKAKPRGKGVTDFCWKPRVGMNPFPPNFPPTFPYGDFPPAFDYPPPWWWPGFDPNRDPARYFPPFGMPMFPNDPGMYYRDPDTDVRFNDNRQPWEVPDLLEDVGA